MRASVWTLWVVEGVCRVDQNGDSAFHSPASFLPLQENLEGCSSFLIVCLPSGFRHVWFDCDCIFTFISCTELCLLNVPSV
mmetsp:Transcript_6511/g.12896  ORF Transcript_6511/g.12896 Transcript_6511/m.12896 type:complete len:81 (-) Transcript_6511:418-660(-)